MKQNFAFFDKHEQHVNRLVAKICCWGVLAGPAMMLAVYFHIFPGADYLPLIIFTGFVVLVVGAQHCFLRLHPYSKSAKYVCLISLEMVVCYLATRENLCLFISYLMVPAVSCLYYDKKFTGIISLICYIAMMVTLFYRSRLPLPFPHDTLSGNAWFAAYGTGATIEYGVCFIILYAVSSAAHEMLNTVYQRNLRIQGMQAKLISSFANLVESKDPTTGEHIKRTSEYVGMICRRLRYLGYYKDELGDDQIDTMIKAAPLHDLGKMEISENILCKPAKLTAEEFDKVKEHPEFGEALIRNNLCGIEDEEYTTVARTMALYHHEHWDGSGYPMHFAGYEIPLAARIMAAADVLDALLSRRPYKDAISLDDTLEIMKEQSGRQFDPAVIEAVLSLKEDIRTAALS